MALQETMELVQAASEEICGKFLAPGVIKSAAIECEVIRGLFRDLAWYGGLTPRLNLSWFISHLPL